MVQEAVMDINRRPMKEMVLRIIKITFISSVISAILLLTGYFAWEKYQSTLPKRIAALTELKTSDPRALYTLSLASYDGNYVQMWYSTNTEESQEAAREIYNSLASGKGKYVKSWSTSFITYPIYSVCVAVRYPDMTAKALNAIWSDGYLLLENGAVYSFNYDFAGLEKKADSVFDSRAFASVRGHAMFSLLAAREGGLNSDYLAPSELDVSTDENLSMCVGAKNVYGNYRYAKVTLMSKETAPIKYGDTAYLEVRVGGTWYQAPLDPFKAGGSRVNSLMYTLVSSDQVEITYDISRYKEIHCSSARIVIPVRKDDGKIVYLADDIDL